MSAFDKQKQYAIDWIVENAGRFSDFHLEIWNYAEPAWREYKSAKAYCDLLGGEGFTVEEGSGEMPTAFAASWGKGGPVLGGYAEYDAVPGNSQQVVPYQAPREGLHPWAAGHTDPHSALGTTALAGILATKAAMEKFGIAGTIKFFGEPAEKVCGSKPVHAAKGYFDGLDACISYHPHFSNTTVWDTHCGSYWSVVFTFETLEPEKWIDKSLMPTKHTSHAAARCPGAIDALCLMYTTTKYTKEAMFPHTGTWTLNEFIMVAGDATSDNLPPRFSQIQYAWRSPTLAIQQQIYNVLANNARHAAGATGCQVSARWVTKTRVGLTNHAMADIAFRNMELVGPPRFGEQAREFARKIQANLNLKPMENPFLEDCERLMPPREYEARLRRALPEWQLNYTSDDYVDYTWHAPTVRLLTMRPRLRPPSDDYEYPAWIDNALGGLPAAINPGIFLGAKTIAATFIDLLTKPELLEGAQGEFKERTGGGIGGTKWVAPLLPKDFKPPVDLRWPEYIQTVRGAEWWIPTPSNGSGNGEKL
ncbi:aminobenzoyl-glutamate utilization protein B [Rhizobiales bacterium GAS188]|nr:aminobenzoyl-glutamate utilization protein B [Rhizobiales bacterium GAS188]